MQKLHSESQLWDHATNCRITQHKYLGTTAFSLLSLTRIRSSYVLVPCLNSGGPAQEDEQPLRLEK